MASPSEEEPVKREDKPEVEVTMFRTKIIKFLGRTTPIIIQDVNGPCPLIAVCNVLLLRDKLGLSPDEKKVSQERLITLVGGNIIASNNNEAGESVNNQLQRIAEAIDMVPSFANPLDVNLRFKRIDELEITKGRAVFDMLDIPLYHGWIVDPQDSDTSNAFGSKCFNTVMTELADLTSKYKDALKLVQTTNPNSDVDKSGPNIRESDERVTSETDPGEGIGSSVEADNTSRGGQMNTSESQKPESSSSAHDAALELLKDMTDETTVKHGILMRNFLRDNGAQLTQYGLTRLQNDIKEGELCVLFRNGHFNTTFKFEGEIYTLVTDEGYINSPAVVWEKLNEVNGDTWWANENFMSYKKVCEIEEIGSSDEDKADLDNTDLDNADLATIFENLLRSNRTAAPGDTSLKSDLQIAQALQRREFAERHVMSRRPPPATFPTGLIVGPDHDYSPLPPRNLQPRSRSLLSRSKKETKRIKEKCTLM